MTGELILRSRQPDATYGWIITQDYLANEAFGYPSAVGVVGPSNMSVENFRRLNTGEGVKFQLFDDDGELYFEGRFVGDADSEEAFGPLHDFGMPDSGCTTIKYQQADGSFVAL